jgi:hypothetical protein
VLVKTWNIHLAIYDQFQIHANRFEHVKRDILFGMYQVTINHVRCFEKLSRYFLSNQIVCSHFYASNCNLYAYIIANMDASFECYF